MALCNIWEIHDDNGMLKSGLQSNMQSIYDLSTMDLTDLAEKYKQNYSRSTLKAKIADYKIDSWVGNLKLIQIHEIHK